MEYGFTFTFATREFSPTCVWLLLYRPSAWYAYVASSGSHDFTLCDRVTELFSWSADVNWPSFGKGENKSQLIDIVSQLHETMFQYTDTTLQSFMHQKQQNRTIKTTISQQYTSFVFPFAENRSADVTSVNRENVEACRSTRRTDGQTPLVIL